MIDFLKRNAKFVAVITVAFAVIAGLSAALIITNTGHGHRGGNRDQRPDRIMHIEDSEIKNPEHSEHSDGSEVQNAYASIDRDRRGDESQRRNRLEVSDRADRDGKMSRADRAGRANKAERLPLTDEQIAEKTEKLLDKLEQKLADGKITQEEYDEKLIKIENGEFNQFERSGKSKKK
ncbi:MAG: hypothetical protein FWD38_10275 [Oscillospiraceae bacterium]|nr:hypothetical protein [Oscillospiraceae bacterium]